MPKQRSFFNLRRLFNIIDSHRIPEDHPTIIALDAEKAFDHVEWAYFAVPVKFHQGDDVLKNV